MASYNCLYPEAPLFETDREDLEWGSVEWATDGMFADATTTTQPTASVGSTRSRSNAAGCRLEDCFGRRPGRHRRSRGRHRDALPSAL